MEIILKNIQSIKEGSYEFPDVGIVQLLGDNSNGKSILIKAIQAVATLKIVDNEERRALINDNSEEGSITIHYRGKILVVKLHEERNRSLVALYRNKEDKIIRTFRDGGIAELLEEFGFRVYNKNALCLQVYETFGLMPFVNTTVGVNYEIVNAVTTDTVAQNFLNNFREVTHKAAKEKLKSLDAKIEDIIKTKAALVLFDHKAYSDIYSRMKSVYMVLKYLDFIHLKEIKIPPKVKIIDVKPPRLNEIKFITPMPIIHSLPSFLEPIKNMRTIMEGKCPVCGKFLVAGHGHPWEVNV